MVKRLRREVILFVNVFFFYIDGERETFYTLLVGGKRGGFFFDGTERKRCT